MQTSKQYLGKKGEQLAHQFLIDKGYRILHRNYRIHYAEVDIIAESEENTVFFEVKTRSSLEFGYPETFVTKKQEYLLMEAAENYCIKNEPIKPIRFDIIAIILTPESTEITHFEDAFWPMA